MDEKYLKQVKLVVDVLQFVATESCFAIKGGTAINLFITIYQDYQLILI